MSYCFTNLCEGEKLMKTHFQLTITIFRILIQKLNG